MGSTEFSLGSLLNEGGVSSHAQLFSNIELYALRALKRLNRLVLPPREIVAEEGFCLAA